MIKLGCILAVFLLVAAIVVGNYYVNRIDLKVIQLSTHLQSNPSTNAAVRE